MGEDAAPPPSDPRIPFRNRVPALNWLLGATVGLSLYVLVITLSYSNAEWWENGLPLAGVISLLVVPVMAYSAAWFGRRLGGR